MGNAIVISAGFVAFGMIHFSATKIFITLLRVKQEADMANSKTNQPQ
jgi:hypothetical protein